MSQQPNGQGKASLPQPPALARERSMKKSSKSHRSDRSSNLIVSSLQSSSTTVPTTKKREGEETHKTVLAKTGRRDGHESNLADLKVPKVKAKKPRRDPHPPPPPREQQQQQQQVILPSTDSRSSPPESETTTAARRSPEWNLERALLYVVHAWSTEREYLGCSNQLVDDNKNDKDNNDTNSQSSGPWITFRLGHAGDVSELARLYRTSQHQPGPDSPKNVDPNPPGHSTTTTTTTTTTTKTTTTSNSQSRVLQAPVASLKRPSLSSSQNNDETTSLEVRLAEGMGDEDHPPILYCLLAFVHQEDDEEEEEKEKGDNSDAKKQPLNKEALLEKIEKGDNDDQVGDDKNDSIRKEETLKQKQEETQEDINRKSNTDTKASNVTSETPKATKRVKSRLAAAALLTEEPSSTGFSGNTTSAIRVEWIFVSGQEEENHGKSEHQKEETASSTTTLPANETTENEPSLPDSTKSSRIRQSIQSRLWLRLSSIGVLLKSDIHLVT